MDILAPCKAIMMFRHWHFGICATVPKYPCTKTSPWRIVDFFDIHFRLKLGTISQLWLKTHGNASLPKNPCADKSLYQSLSIQMSMETKCPCAGTPIGSKHACAEIWHLSDCLTQQLCDNNYVMTTAHC